MNTNILIFINIIDNITDDLLSSLPQTNSLFVMLRTFTLALLFSANAKEAALQLEAPLY